MPTQLEYEMRHHAMVRMMFGDISESARKQIYELHSADIDATEPGYKESCARWVWILTVYSKDIDDLDLYFKWIEIAFLDKEDLDKDEDWKGEMRSILPKQFIKKIEKTSFSQTARGAVMDDTPLKRNTGEQKIRAIFRR